MPACNIFYDMSGKLYVAFLPWNKSLSTTQIEKEEENESKSSTFQKANKDGTRDTQHMLTSPNGNMET